MKFKGWFEREEALIQAACEKRHTPCIRKTVDTIHIGDAVVDLQQLQRSLDRIPIHSTQMVVDAWVDTAILHQCDVRPKGHIASVFPHIRPPPDKHNIPWAVPIANERLMLCLVFDEQKHLRYLNPIDIANFNMGTKGLQGRASTNLSLRPPYQLPECRPHPEHANVWIVSTGDGHDAARILMANQIAGSTVIAWVPHRDLLMFSTLSIPVLGSTAAALRKECIQRAQSATHPISAEAFRVHEDKITHLPFRKTSANGELILPDG